MKAWICAVSVAIGACAVPQPPNPATLAPAGPQPTTEQAEIVVRAYLARVLKDPDSLKQFAITRTPYEKMYRALPSSSWRVGYIVCFEYNAKNSYGGYGGVKPGAIVIQGSTPEPHFLEALPDPQAYC